MLEKFGIGPGEGCVRIQRALDPVEHAANSQLLRRSSGVVDSGRPIFRHPNGPFCQISRINELHRIARVARRQHFAPAVNPYWPIGEAVTFVAWSHNQTRANDERFLRKPLLRFLLAQRLERSVSFVTRGLHRFERFFERIGALILCQRRVLVHAGAGVGVNRNCRNENVTLDVSLQNLRGITKPRRQRGWVIDTDVPLFSFQRLELTIAIPDQLLNFLGQFAGMRFAAIKNGDLMPAA